MQNTGQFHRKCMSWAHMGTTNLHLGVFSLMSFDCLNSCLHLGMNICAVCSWFQGEVNGGQGHSPGRIMFYGQKRPSSGLQAAQGKSPSPVISLLCFAAWLIPRPVCAMNMTHDTLNSPLSNLQEIRGVVQERTFPNSSGSSCCPFLIIKRAYTPFSDTPLWAPSTVST